jgi:hypothetical protein
MLCSGLLARSYMQALVLPTIQCPCSCGPEICAVGWANAQVETSAVPRNSCAKAAAAMPLDDLERAVRTERGFAVHFTDVAHSVDLHRVLDRWEGQFVLTGPDAEGNASARFSRPEAVKEVGCAQIPLRITSAFDIPCLDMTTSKVATCLVRCMPVCLNAL